MMQRSVDAVNNKRCSSTAICVPPRPFVFLRGHLMSFLIIRGFFREQAVLMIDQLLDADKFGMVLPMTLTPSQPSLATSRLSIVCSEEGFLWFCRRTIK